MSDRVLNAIDLCAGAGGWACAARGLPIRITLAVDIWPVATRTYGLNHGDTRIVVGDLREPDIQAMVLAEAKNVDLVLGGIPCEWISIYRNLTKTTAAEIDSQRATLDSVLDMVRAINPPYWCLEDVTGLIKELPPLTPYQIIDSRHFSGQRRKRVYVGRFPSVRPNGDTRLFRDYVRPGPYRIGRRAIDRIPTLRRTFTNTNSLAVPLDRKALTVLSMGSRRDAECVAVDERLAGGKRQLEWQELAALQGFPEDYIFFGSPTDVGNAGR